MTVVVRPVNMSAQEAIQLVKRFLPEWCHLTPTDVSVKRSQAGISNEVYFVKVTDDRTIADGVPRNLVVRKYDPDRRHDAHGIFLGLQAMTATHTEQLLVQTSLAHMSLGPKQIGLTPNARIEEWIDCRPMTYADARDPVLERDIAISMARVHALRLPFKRPSYHFLDILKDMYAGLQPHLSFFEEEGSNAVVRSIARYDFKALLHALQPLLSPHLHRTVLINWDMHTGNMAVLNGVASDDQLKVMLFDFELTGYNMRGKDLGNFLLSRSGYAPYVREDRQIESNEQFFPFLRAYLHECERLFPDMDRDGRDSLDHLMRESLLGSVVCCLYYLFFQMKINAVDRGRNPVLKTYAHRVPFDFECLMQSLQALSSRYPQSCLLPETLMRTEHGW